VAALVLFVGGGSRFAIGLTLKPIVEEMATGRAAISLAVAAFQLVSALCLLPAGRLADRRGATTVLAVGLAVSAVGSGLTAFATAPWQVVLLYGVVFAIGNGLASLIPIGVMVSRRFPERIGTANAVALAGMGLGQLVMMAGLAGVLEAIGWRQVFLIVALAHVVVVPAVLLVIGRLEARSKPVSIAAAAPLTPASPAAESGHMTLGEALRTRRMWLLLAVYALCGLEDFFVSTHIVAFAQDPGADALLAGWLLAGMGLMALLGVLAAGAASDRLGPVWPTLAAFMLRVVIFAVVLVDQSTPTVATFALLFGATFLVTAPLTAVFVRETFGTRHLGTITGTITMVHHVAGGLGALVGALIFDAGGAYDAALWLMLATSVVGCVLTLMLRQKHGA
jgi:MFS family permease